jgi:uncharacterized protein YndB with AHSA1/START domain
MVAPLETNPELVIERVFDAPRQLVWQAWTDPQQMLKWGGPRSHPIVQGEGEFKVGGKWRACLRSVETDEDLWQGGEYREIKPPEKLVHTFHWEDDDGKPENEMLLELTFEEQGPKKTKLTLKQTEFRSVEQRDGHRGGWSSALDRLEEFLTTGKVIPEGKA